MWRKLTIVLALLSLAASPQDYARHSLYFYDGSGNLEYICSAASEGHGTATWAIADKSLTSIVDASNTATVTTGAAHGLTAGATVVIAGVTTDTDLNGTYTVLTVPLSTTFTVTTANVTDATYADATMTVAYTGPLATNAIWSIQRFFYNASNNPVKSAYAVGTPAVSGRVATDRICASRASYVYR